MYLAGILNKFVSKFPKPLIAISLMVISGLFFVFMHSAVKYLSKEVHIFEIAFFRCALVIFVLAPIILQQGKSVFVTGQPKIQFLRITTNSVAMLCFFYGLTITSLSQVTALNLTVPIFTTFLAFLFLKEKLKIRRMIALFVGFLGTMIVLRPDLSFNLGGFLILTSALIWSISLISVSYTHLTLPTIYSV